MPGPLLSRGVSSTYTTRMPAMVATCRGSAPYRAALGIAFDTLDPEVQRAHLAPLAAAGTFDVEHGSTWFAPLLARLLKLPAAGRAQPVSLDVRAEGNQLLWTRDIGDVRLSTRQQAAGAHIVERAGLGTIVFALAVENGALVYAQVSFSVAKVPLPRVVAPQVSARVSTAPSFALRTTADRRDGWHVEVHVSWRGHLVCRYSGPMAIR